MTFEEALEIALEAKKKWGGGSSEAWLVNALVALGAIKLDDPHIERFRKGMKDIGVHLSEVSVRVALEKSGLKLVPCSPQESIHD